MRRFPQQFAYSALFVGAVLSSAGWFHIPAGAAAEIDAVTKVMKGFVKDREISGAVTLVAEKGKIVHLSAVGRADLESRTPMTVDTPFAIASMTKPITATAFMTLVDEGKVSVDDPVAPYIPSFAEAKLAADENGYRAPVEGLKIRHLLTHTSGLVGSQGMLDSLAATAEDLAKRPFGFQPGTKWEYSPGMNVVARIASLEADMSYEELVKSRILEPLGMTHTTFHPSKEMRKRIATLYERQNASSPLRPSQRAFARGEPDAVPSPSGGLLSTAEDMQKFYQMILNGGELDGTRIVSAESVKAMTTVQTGDELVTGFTPGNGWGLGWCIVRAPLGITEKLSPGSFGHGGAFGTQGWVDPVKQRIYVLLIQRSNLPNSDASNIRREFQRAAADALDGDAGSK